MLPRGSDEPRRGLIPGMCGDSATFPSGWLSRTYGSSVSRLISWTAGSSFHPHPDVARVKVRGLALPG